MKRIIDILAKTANGRRMDGLINWFRKYYPPLLPPLKKIFSSGLVFKNSSTSWTTYRGGGLPPPACKTNEGRELVTFDKIYIFTNNIFNKSGGVGLGVYRGVGVYIEE